MAKRKKRLSTLIGSMLLALVIWGYVTLAKVYENDIEVPLTVAAPPNQALLSSIPGTITVRVRGTGLQIINLKYLSKGTECRIDLSQLRASEQSAYTADRDDIVRFTTMPSALRVMSVSPAMLQMSTGDLATRIVPIELRTNIACRDGFMLMNTPNPEPVNVELRGTKRVIEAINSWPTQKLSLADLYGNVHATVPVSDSLMTVLNVVPSSISVTLDVQQIADVAFIDIPIQRSASDARDVAVFPNRISITVRGGVDRIAGLTSDDFRVELPPSASGPTIPTLSAPTGVTIVGMNPPYVRVLNNEASP